MTGKMARLKINAESGPVSIARVAALAVLLLPASAAPVSAQPLPQAQPEEVGMSSSRLSRLDEVVKKAIDDGQTPGAVLLVARRGAVVYRKAFGQRIVAPETEPMSVDTIFDMASLTKVIATASAIMILIEEGRISLTDPVADYVPEFGRHGKDIVTIVQLLTHFSGLRPDLDLDESWSGAETALNLAFEEKLVSPPGERFAYSDINYIVLGDLVQRVSGMSLDRFCSARIFAPLGMSDTGFNPPESQTARIAPSEWRNGTMLRGQVHDPTASRMEGVAGHAGLFSSPDDVSRFAQAILNGGALDGNRILAPLSVQRMTTNQSPPGRSEWRGVGFDIRTPFSSPRGDLFTTQSFGHTGFTGTSLWIDPPTETFVILMSNRLHPNGEGDVSSLRKKVASVTAAAIVDEPWKPSQTRFR